MQLTLVVPGLLDFAEAEPLRVDAEGASWARLLAGAKPAKTDGGTLGLLCAALGIARQRDWPVAPVLAAASNLDPGDDYWLLAEPVVLQVGQLDVRLAALVDDLTADESAALLAMLNAHFASDGLRFIAIGPARWLIAVAKVQQLVTHPADDALGAPIAAFLPEGPDAARWRRWQSEIQMLLFAHPVSAEREQRGRAPINGVWVSGGGVLADAQAMPRIASLYTDAPLPRDLARARGVAIAPAPRSFRDWGASDPKSPSLVWLSAGASRDDTPYLAALGRDWADPLRADLDATARLELAVVLSGRGRARSYALRRPSLAARWRRRFAQPALSKLLAEG
jgi:hypothetical protein